MGKKTQTSKSSVYIPEAGETELELTELLADAAQQQYQQIAAQMTFQNQIFSELFGLSQMLYPPQQSQYPPGTPSGTDPYATPAGEDPYGYAAYRSDPEAFIAAAQGQYGGQAPAGYTPSYGGQPAPNQLLFNDPDIQQALSAGATSQLLGLELERSRTGVATPEQAAALQQAADLSFQAGANDIETAATRQIQSLQRELAPALGLRGRDTPIVERGGRIGEEALRQVGQLSRNVRTAQQQAMIDASLQQGALNQGLLSQGSQLSQRAFENRLNLLGQAGQLGLGLAGIGNPLGALQVIQAPRLAQTTTRTKNTQSDPLGTIIGLTGAAGGLLSSVGGAVGGGGGFGGGGGGGGYSSIAMKDRWGPVPASEWARRLEALPVEFWSYKEDPEATMHAGLYAEHFREAFGLGDGEKLDYLDAIGVLFALVKHLVEERPRG